MSVFKNSLYTSESTLSSDTDWFKTDSAQKTAELYVKLQVVTKSDKKVIRKKKTDSDHIIDLKTKHWFSKSDQSQKSDEMMSDESDTEMAEALTAAHKTLKAIYCEACEPFNKLAQNCSDTEVWETLHCLNKKIKEQNCKNNIAEDLFAIKIKTFKVYFW